MDVTKMQIIGKVTTKVLSYIISYPDGRKEPYDMPAATYSVVDVYEHNGHKFYVTNIWHKEHKRSPLTIVDDIVEKYEPILEEGGYLHGSPHNFCDTGFKLGAGKGQGENLWGKGLYFTKDESLATYYAKFIKSKDVTDRLEQKVADRLGFKTYSDIPFDYEKKGVRTKYGEVLKLDLFHQYLKEYVDKSKDNGVVYKVILFPGKDKSEYKIIDFSGENSDQPAKIKKDLWDLKNLIDTLVKNRRRYTNGVKSFFIKKDWEFDSEKYSENYDSTLKYMRRYLKDSEHSYDLSSMMYNLAYDIKKLFKPDYGQYAKDYYKIYDKQKVLPIEERLKLSDEVAYYQGVQFTEFIKDAGYSALTYWFSPSTVPMDKEHEHNARAIVVFDDKDVEIDKCNVAANGAKVSGVEYSAELAPNGKPSNLTPEQYRLVRTPAFKKWFGDWENDPKNSSKVVDENGEPLVVLHGSPIGNTTEFLMDKGAVKSSGLREYGMYFTTNKNIAKLYQRAKKIEKTDEFKNKLNALEEKIRKVRNNIEYDRLSKEIDSMLYGRIYEVFLNLREIKTFDGKGMSGLDAYNNLEVDAGYAVKTGREAMNLLTKGYIGWNDLGQEIIVEKVDGIKADNIVELSEDSDKYKYWKDDYIGTTYLVFPNEEGKFNNIKLADGSNITFDGSNPDIRFAKGGLIAPNGKKSNLTPEQYRLVRTPAFKKWFGDWENSPETSSKVIDENGEPLVVYHGTRNNFSVFDIKKGGESNSLASVGFWFSPLKSFAQNFAESIWYGEKDNFIIQDVFLSIKNPKIFTTETDNDNEKNNLSKKIYDLDKNIRQKTDYWNGDYSEMEVFRMATDGRLNDKNFDYYSNRTKNSKEAIKDGFEVAKLWDEIKKLKSRYNDLIYSDSYEKLRTEIHKIEGGDSERANTGGIGMSLRNGNKTILEYKKSLISKDYDGLIIEKTRFDSKSAGGINDQYVAFYPEQIKLADGSNTTFEGSNPDIRFDDGGGVPNGLMDIVENYRKKLDENAPPAYYGFRGYSDRNLSEQQVKIELQRFGIQYDAKYPIANASDHPNHSMCSNASYSLAKKLRDAGFNARVIAGYYLHAGQGYYVEPSMTASSFRIDVPEAEGSFSAEEHWWVECNGLYIDVTADQFHPYDPQKQEENRIIVGKKEDLVMKSHYPIRREFLGTNGTMTPELDVLAEKMNVKLAKKKLDSYGIYGIKHWVKKAKGLTPQQVIDLNAQIKTETYSRGDKHTYPEIVKEITYGNGGGIGKISIETLVVKTLEDYPSGSSLDFYNGNIYLIGDDAKYISVLDTDFNEIDKIHLFEHEEVRVPKPEKRDIETSTIMNIKGVDQLILIGSGSKKKRRRIFFIPLINETPGLPKKLNVIEEEYDNVKYATFINKLEKRGVEVNIEGCVAIKEQIILSNRGNKSNPNNYIIVTEKEFWSNQEKSQVIVSKIKLPEGSGISEMTYDAEGDVLFFTATTESTGNVYDDGKIGDSFIGYVSGVSDKIHDGAVIIPDDVVTLASKDDDTFSNYKIEGICIEKKDEDGYIINLVSDNDDGKSTMFKVKVKIDLVQKKAADGRIISNEGLSYLLGEKGAVEQIGSEKKHPVDKDFNEIELYVSEYGSYRFVIINKGKIISAIQVMSKDGKNGYIANAYTHPSFRRKGLGSFLVKFIQKYFKNNIRFSRQVYFRGKIRRVDTSTTCT